jgi:hypothetical protein
MKDLKVLTLEILGATGIYGDDAEMLQVMFDNGHITAVQAVTANTQPAHYEGPAFIPNSQGTLWMSCRGTGLTSGINILSVENGKLQSRQWHTVPGGLDAVTPDVKMMRDIFIETDGLLTDEFYLVAHSTFNYDGRIQYSRLAEAGRLTMREYQRYDHTEVTLHHTFDYSEDMIKNNQMLPTTFNALKIASTEVIGAKVIANITNHNHILDISNNFVCSISNTVSNTTGQLQQQRKSHNNTPGLYEEIASYDSEGRLFHHSNPGGTSVKYMYDAESMPNVWTEREIDMPAYGLKMTTNYARRIIRPQEDGGFKIEIHNKFENVKEVIVLSHEAAIASMA